MVKEYKVVVGTSNVTNVEAAQEATVIINREALEGWKPISIGGNGFGIIHTLPKYEEECCNTKTEKFEVAVYVLLEREKRE